MLKVAVLGANGFVGSRLVEIFHLNHEFRTIPIVHSVAGLSRVARFAMDWRIADATDALALADSFRDCDVVVHTIAGSLESIVKSPRATLEACKTAGVRRIVYLSTASVHGQDPDPGTDETSPLHTRHVIPYNNAKVVAERAFLGQHRRFGVELVALRPGIVFGPRDVWITGIAKAIADGTAVLVGGGAGYCNSIYIDNLVHAVRCAMSSDANGEVFLVGDDEPIVWHELYRYVANVLGHFEPIPTVSTPPLRPPPFDLVEAIRAIPNVQRLIDHTPKVAKSWARRQLEAATHVRQAMRGAYRHSEVHRWRSRSKTSPPKVSVEMALLHSCRHHFSYEMARTRLGYRPPVPLAEGLARTAGWLEFIGYAVQPSTAVSSSLRKSESHIEDAFIGTDHISSAPYLGNV